MRLRLALAGAVALAILVPFFCPAQPTGLGVTRRAAAAVADAEAARLGIPVGVRRREPFREHRVTFAPGDRLVLYSDGLIEAVGDDGEPYGFPRFEECIERNAEGRAGEIRQALLSGVKRFTRNRPAEDDQTLVVIAFEDVGEERLRKAG